MRRPRCRSSTPFAVAACITPGSSPAHPASARRPWPIASPAACLPANAPATRSRLDPASPVFRRIAAASHADLLTIEREWDEKKSRMRGEIVVDDARAISAFLPPDPGGGRLARRHHRRRRAPQPQRRQFRAEDAGGSRRPRPSSCSPVPPPARLLPTIRSRCRRLALAPLAPPDMALALAEYLPGLPPGERERLGDLAAGSPGRALLLAEETGLQLAALADEILAHHPPRAEAARLRICREARRPGGRTALPPS